MECGAKLDLDEANISVILDDTMVRRPIGSGRNTGSPARIRTTREKKWRDRLIAQALGHPDWVLGFQDEVWRSRLAQPHLQTWTDDKPLHWLQNEPDRHDPASKAVACYGLLWVDTQVPHG